MTEHDQPGTPSLAGLRVLDLGWVWAGPLVGAALADLGADVVKVEAEGRFDPYRLRGVERRRDLGELRREASPSFHKLNRSKRSIALNLRTAEGLDVLLRLAGRADLLLENFSAGTQERLGLGWERLKAANPEIVSLSMSAGGQQGQWRDLRAYALVTSGLAGYESLVAYEGEEPVGAPTFGVADPTVSAFGLLGALAAIWRARRTGRGAYIDLSGVEALMGVMPEAFLDVEGNRDGHERTVAAFEFTLGDVDEDRWVVFVVTSEAQWNAFCQALGGTPPATWARLAEAAGARVASREWLAGLPLQSCVAAAAAAGVASAPVLSVEERNATAPIRDLMGELTHPVTGPEPWHPSPWGTWREPSPAPRLGEHTDAVLQEWLGMEAAELADLRDSGAFS